MSTQNGCGNFGCFLLMLLVGVPWLISAATGTGIFGMTAAVMAMTLGLWVVGTVIVNTILRR